MGTSSHWGRSHIRKQSWWKGLWVQFSRRCRRRNIEEVHNPVWLLQISPEDGSHTFSLLPISFLVGRIIVSSHWHNTLTYDLNKLINSCPIMQKVFPVLLQWSSGHYIWMTEFYIKLRTEAYYRVWCTAVLSLRDLVMVSESVELRCDCKRSRWSCLRDTQVLCTCQCNLKTFYKKTCSIIAISREPLIHI